MNVYAYKNNSEEDKKSIDRVHTDTTN